MFAANILNNYFPEIPVKAVNSHFQTLHHCDLKQEVQVEFRAKEMEN